MQAAGAYDIIERMAEQGPRPAPITVYRALDFLAAHGLVHKIESRNAFVACSHSHEGEPAALLVCEACGTVAELDVAGHPFADLRAGGRRRASGRPHRCRDRRPLRLRRGACMLKASWSDLLSARDARSTIGGRIILDQCQYRCACRARSSP